MNNKFREDKCNIDFEVYGYSVQVIFTTDLQKSRNRYDGIIGHSFDVTGVGALHAFKDNQSFIFFYWTANAEQIAHESWHAIHRLALWTGIGHENEFIAYHLGHLVGGIHSFQKYIKNKRKK